MKNCQKLILATGLCAFLFACSSDPVVETKTKSSAAQAANEDEGLDDVRASAPAVKKTRYQVMFEGFDSATQMPSLNDFDPLDEPAPSLACYSSKAADPNAISDFLIKQMMVQVTGAPDYGPLFPGSVDHVETRLVIGKNNGWVSSQNLSNDMRKVFELARAPGSLVIKINENKFGIYTDIGAPAEVWLRKNGQGQIFFRVYKLEADKKRNEVFIGYCYKKRANTSVPPASSN